MKKFLAAVLMLAALLLGLLLPSASMGLLDGQAERDEATELQQVDLAAASGLSTMKSSNCCATRRAQSLTSAWRPTRRRLRCPRPAGTF